MKRTNEQAAAVLTNIQTLANIIGRYKEELDSGIAQLSLTDQEAIHRGFQGRPLFPDPFDEFLRYILSGAAKNLLRF